MRRYLICALLAAIGAGSLAATGARAAPVGSPAVEAERDSAPARGNPLWGIPLTSLTATGERPIFSPARRRPAPPPPPPVAAAPPPPQPTAAEPEQIPLRLLGTITSPRNAIAICFNQASSEVIRLRIGESHDGWTLRDVHAREAVFEKASARTTLALPSPDDPQAVSAPPQLPVAGIQVRTPYPPANAGQQPPATASSALPSGTWRDGDGNLIAPPPKARR
jgi:general secretion pathway protein N